MKASIDPVKPETVVRWHRAGFKLYWAWISRRQAHAGRNCVSRELRELIFRIVSENPTWGALRIHGELKMLGFDIFEANRIAMDAKGAPESRTGKAMDNLSKQSS